MQDLCDRTVWRPHETTPLLSGTRKCCREILYSCSTHREIIRRYGPELVGRLGTLRLVCMSRAKEMVYRLSSCVGMERRLVQARNTAISREEFQYASRVLALVKQTQLAGVGDEHILASSRAGQR